MYSTVWCLFLFNLTKWTADFYIEVYIKPSGTEDLDKDCVGVCQNRVKDSLLL